MQYDISDHIEIMIFSAAHDPTSALHFNTRLPGFKMHLDSVSLQRHLNITFKQEKTSAISAMTQSAQAAK